MRDQLFLCLDTETIPSQSPAIIAEIAGRYVVPEVDLSAIVADARLTDPAKIEADIAKKKIKAVEDREAALLKAEAARDADYRKLALDGATAHLACLSFALGDADIEHVPNIALERFDGRYAIPSFDDVLNGERLILIEFFGRLRELVHAWIAENVEAAIASGMNPDEARRSVSRECAPVIVAHYADFDIRVIWQRAKILGITPPVWWPLNYSRYRTDEVYDTMTAWAGPNGRISLDDLCKALGVPGKDGFDGSMVWNAIQAGKLDEVCVYCDDDVERVSTVHKILSDMPLSGVHPGLVADALYEAAAAAADRDHGVVQDEVA
jgi:hypothetical protein